MKIEKRIRHRIVAFTRSIPQGNSTILSLVLSDKKHIHIYHDHGKQTLSLIVFWKLCHFQVKLLW